MGIDVDKEDLELMKLSKEELIKTIRELEKRPKRKLSERERYEIITDHEERIRINRFMSCG